MKEQLQKLRKNKQLTQEEISDILGVKLSTYQKYERDVISPPYDTLIKIAKFYGVSTDYLLGLEPQPNPLAELNLNVRVNDEKFIELYSALPDEVKKIFVDTMSKLSNAAIDSKNSIRKSTTYTCGELEDMKKAETEDAG